MMRAQPDPPDLMLELLLANAELARLRRGMFYDGPLVERRIPPNPVLSSVPSRSSADHVREWRAATGTGSAQALMQQERAAIPGLLYDIGHAQGFGQVGPVAHDPLNLSAISRGANTSMIPPDAAVSGMPGWQVDTRAFVRPHTVVAEWIQQRFIGPDGRVHTFDVDAQRPEVFQTEVRTLRRLAREQMFGERQDSSSSESDQDDADGEDER